MILFVQKQAKPIYAARSQDMEAAGSDWEGGRGPLAQAMS